MMSTKICRLALQVEKEEELKEMRDEKENT
jgi:hypothetical protein